MESHLLTLASADLERCDQAASFLQTGFWGSFKTRFGWNARAFTIRWEESGSETSLLVLRRRLAPALSLSYIPWGPELPASFPEEKRENALAECAAALRGFLPHDTTLIRFDPPWYSEGEGTPPPTVSPPLRRAASDIQCPDTSLVDLTGSEDAILANMKPKCRYNIRLALKKGVEVIDSPAEELPTFYALLEETAARDGIAIHNLSYYQGLFACAREYGKKEKADGSIDVRLYLARHEGDVLAGIVALFRPGHEAVYLYGASSNHKRNLMAPYALQWQAMRDARKLGCRFYDLFGMPPSADPQHPMAGLYLFKSGFGGKMIHRPGSWDYPLRPVSAELFRSAESARKKLRDRKKIRSHEKSEKQQ